jgi:mono/diheme cytochrome c family protein
MTETQNRRRLIENLIGLLATQIVVFALAFYIYQESTRIETAQNQVLNLQLEDAMSLYAENCAVCHGLNGEGIGSNPALNNPALAEMPYEDLYKTISRGRYGTSMPAWSKDDGGPLSDYQISEMVGLVQAGDWAATGDRVVNLGLAPLIPFTTQPDVLLLEQVGTLPDGPTLQAAIQLFAAECVACHGADGLGTKIAPTLNNPLVRQKTADELNRTITFGSAGTLMAAWSNKLAPEQISGMVSLIQRWDEIPAGAIPAPDVPIATTAESLALGQTLFSQNCSRCHGPEGQGTQRAPALNVKSFLTDTNDQAIEQIVTGGVPGTAMPAWGDRMTQVDIQAIVGFIRQWEASAPEVAIPTRGSGGGPPWLRTNSTTTTTNANTAATTQTGAMATGAGTGTGSSSSGQGNGQGGGQNQVASTPAWWQTLNWPILLGLTALLSIAFTLISKGYTTLKKK